MNKQIFAILSASLFAQNALGQDLPNIFTPSTPAKAAEVNENFDYLNEKLKLIEAASIGLALKAGEKTIEVDCSENPAALNESYIENWSFSELNFAITGDCYGDITVNRSSTNDAGEWDFTKLQPAGQTLNIYGESADSAGLIPNDLSGSVTNWATLGGGLYLSDLTLTLADGDTGAGFSRNGHGDLTNVSIVGPESVSGTGVFVQEGGQVYISGSTITGTDYGIVGINGAAIRMLSENTITDVNHGISLTNSNLRSQATQIIEATEFSIELYNSASFNSFGSDIIINGGAIRLVANSTFQAQNMTAENSTMWLNASVFQVYGSIALADMDASGSRFAVAGGVVNGTTNLVDGSYAQLHDVTYEQLIVDRRSSAYINGGNIKTLKAQHGGTISGNGITVSELIEVSQRGMAFLGDTTSPAVFSGFDGYVNFYGESKPVTSGISCNNGFVTYDGLSMLDDLPDSGCIDHGVLYELRELLLERRGQ